MSRKKPPKINRPLRKVGDPIEPPKKRPPIRSGVTPWSGKTPKLKRATVFGKVPEIYREVFADAMPKDGPGKPPEGFLQAFSSNVEWIVYYWLWFLLQCEGDVRLPPFVGGRGANGSFTYQINFFGGRRSPGGAVPDFMVLRPTRALIIRLQGEWQHVFVHATKIETDLFQKGRLSGQGFEVIDIYEQHLLEDPYSRRGTVPRVLSDALEGISWVGPIMGGNPVRMRLPFS